MLSINALGKHQGRFSAEERAQNNARALVMPTNPLSPIRVHDIDRRLWVKIKACDFTR